MLRKFSYPFLLLLIWGGVVFAQTPPSIPPRTVQVIEPTVPLRFGSFTAPLSSSGSVTVSAGGSITPGGDVYLMGGTVQQGMFEFKLLPGRTVIIRYPVTATISGIGSAGGSMTLTDLTFSIEGGVIEQSGSGYIQFQSNVGSNAVHRIYMGGKLLVGNTIINPPGDYNDNVQLTIESF